MPHLPDERLAALFDEPPTPAELAHLASCERCATERAAYRNIRSLAMAEQARIGAPLSNWESLAPALRTDGVIDTGEWRVARRPGRFAGVWSQAAAAVLIAIGAIAYGRYTAGGAAAVPGLSRYESIASSRAADSTILFSKARAYRVRRRSGTRHSIRVPRSISPRTIRSSFRRILQPRCVTAWRRSTRWRAPFVRRSRNRRAIL